MLDINYCILILIECMSSNSSFFLTTDTESTAESELDVTPTSKMIQFLVKDEVGTLASALQIFSVSFGIYNNNIVAIIMMKLNINPRHACAERVTVASHFVCLSVRLTTTYYFNSMCGFR
jgi:hypothetical protein